MRHTPDQKPAAGLSQRSSMSTVKVASEITISLISFSVLAQENRYEQVSCYAIAMSEGKIKSSVFTEILPVVTQ